MGPKEIKVKFVDGHFVPLDKVNLKNGTIIEIEIVSRKRKVQQDGLEKEFAVWDLLSDESLGSFEKQL